MFIDKQRILSGKCTDSTTRALVKFEAANKELHLARAGNRDRVLHEAQQVPRTIILLPLLAQREAWTEFESMTNSARKELDLQKERRVASFQVSG